MLTADDTPTVRFALTRRLDKEPGVRIVEIKFLKGPEHMTVGVLLLVGNIIIVRSRFELPIPFEIGHLHDEIDEIAEKCKEARRDFFNANVAFMSEKDIGGTGLRGRWSRYGLRLGLNA